MPIPTDSIKISQLPAVVTPQSTDEFPANNSGTTRKMTPGQLSSDYRSLSVIPTAVYNGNRSYSLTFANVDYTTILSYGTRIRTSATVTPPTRNANLNGTNQYFNKVAPGSLSFTDDWAAGAWVKKSAKQIGTVISRFNGTSGWHLRIGALGATDLRVQLTGFNAGSGNYSSVISRNSIAENRWVHVVAQHDMSSFTTSATTSYVMIDGVDVPCFVQRGGTNPTALVQAGDLEIGRNNSSEYFDGKIAQAWVSSAKLTQANARTLYSQTLTAALISTNNIVSAYSFDNSINDLNTTTANNLTAQNSAAATNVDSFAGAQSSGSFANFDYGVVMGATLAGSDTVVTVQVAEGNTIPTTGGIASIVYSTQDVPYGFPDAGKFRISTFIAYAHSANYVAANQWLDSTFKMTVPIGKFRIGFQGTFGVSGTAASVMSAFFLLASATPTNAKYDYKNMARLFNGASVQNLLQDTYKEERVSLASATDFKIWVAFDAAGGAVTWAMRGDQGIIEMFADVL